jgi:hypothetical protein
MPTTSTDGGTSIVLRHLCRIQIGQFVALSNSIHIEQILMTYNWKPMMCKTLQQMRKHEGFQIAFLKYLLLARVTHAIQSIVAIHQNEHAHFCDAKQLDRLWLDFSRPHPFMPNQADTKSLFLISSPI